MQKIKVCFFISLLLSGCWISPDNNYDDYDDYYDDSSCVDNDAIDYYNAGLKKMKQGDYRGAKKKGEESLRAYKGCDNSIEPVIRCLITEADYKLGMYDAAIKEADAVIKYCNANSTWKGSCSNSYHCALYYRGGSYFTQKNYPAAEKDFLWLRDASDQLREEVTYYLAAAYANQGKYNAAIAEADKIIRMRGAYAGKAAELKQQVNRMRGRQLR